MILLAAYLDRIGARRHHRCNVYWISGMTAVRGQSMVLNPDRLEPRRDEPLRQVEVPSIIYETERDVGCGRMG